MSRVRMAFAAAFVAVAASTAAPAATVVTKPPDLGPFWSPLSNGGSYVYAGSFICPPGETIVGALGTWLQPLGAVDVARVGYFTMLGVRYDF